mgnify:FL=1
MSILTATLLSLLYFWGNSAFVLGVNWWTVMRPLVSGFLAGVILGDPVKGAMVGARLTFFIWDSSEPAEPFPVISVWPAWWAPPLPLRAIFLWRQPWLWQFLWDCWEPSYGW